MDAALVLRRVPVDGRTRPFWRRCVPADRSAFEPKDWNAIRTACNAPSVGGDAQA